MMRHYPLFIGISFSFLQLHTGTSVAFSTTTTISSSSIRHSTYSAPTLTTYDGLRPLSLMISNVISVRGGSSDDEVVEVPKSTSDVLPMKTAMLPTTTASISSTILPVLLVLNTWLSKTLQTGPMGVIGLTCIASMINIPITQYKNLYGISVGYGLSVAAMATVLRQTFTIIPRSMNDIISTAALVYGLRLAIFLFLRDISGARSMNTNKKSPRLARIPFAISLSLFYAFMMTPLLYLMRNPIVATTTGIWKSYVGWTGCTLAWLGVIVEAIADTHKSIVKQENKMYDISFRGPTEGLYSITRHPNYTGEILFWIGLYVTGIPAIQNSIIGWVCSTIGLYGIISIMRGATKSLEKKQMEKYKGQSTYEQWKKTVPVALFPFL